MASLKRKAGNMTSPELDSKKPKTNGSIASFFSAAPKPAQASGGTAPASKPAVKFDKEKWVASLTPEQKQLLTLEIETLDESWLALLKDDIVTKEFLDLKRFLDRETAAGKKWFPPKEDVYSWSRHTPFNDVKVVIVGQDPYHNVNQAHGMAFSVRPPTPAPPSLKNMYIALQKDYPAFVVPPGKAGHLIKWADRGVLMLNTCLTVRAHEANSHSNRGWERLTQKIIDLIAQKRTRGVVFMAWGTPAGKRVVKVDKQKHLVLQSVHPSPLSASRGFFHCGHFKKANEWLVSRYGADAEIDWALVDGNSTLASSAPEEDQTAEQKADEKEAKDEKLKTTNAVKPKAVGTEKKPGKENVDFDGEIGTDDEAALDEALKAAEQQTSK